MAAKYKIGPLTSLRFFAAFLVVLYHSTPDIHAQPMVLQRLISIGFISVSFFFMLSGYILAIVYLQANRPLDNKKFWLARFARIYPLFFVSLLMDLPFLLLERAAKYGWNAALLKSSFTLAGNVVMLQALIPQLNSLNNPVWSLSVETAFYLLFPFTGWMLWKLSANKSLLAIGAMYLTGLSIVTAATFLHLPETVIKYNPVFHLHEFFAGIALARWHTLQLESPYRQLKLKRLAPWISALATAIFICVVLRSNRLPYFLAHDGLLIPVYALIIIGFGSGNRIIDRIFSASWLVILGEASYGLYLIHLPLSKCWSKTSWPFPPFLIAAVTLSVVLFYWFEMPARRWLLHQAHVRSKENAQTSSLAQ